MAEFATVAGQYGPWVAIVLMLVYIGMNKLGPQWLAQASEEKRARMAAESNLFERFIEQQEKTLKFVASATSAIQALGSSVDQNTQQIYKLTEKVDDSGRCPLPDCPFMANRSTP